MAPLISTAIGMPFSSGLMILHLKGKFTFHVKNFSRVISKIFLGSLIMFIIVSLIELVLNQFMTTRLLYFFELIILILLGSLTYGYFVLKTNLAVQLLGIRALTIKQKLRIK